MKTIFVVDDSSTNLLLAEKVLMDDYDVITMLSAFTMFDLLENVTPDLILLDIMMPDINGFEVLERLKTSSHFSAIPVVLLTGITDVKTETRGFEMGAADFVTKPFSKPVLLNRIKAILNVEDIIRGRTEKLREQTKLLEKRTEKLMRLQNSMTSVLAHLVENRDKLTGEHIERTTAYIEILLYEMMDKGIYQDEMQDWSIDIIISAARLHDMGKIVVSDTILNKPGKLTEEEFEIIKGHTLAGESILEDITKKAGDDDFLQHARLLAVSHHERWDGTGYPHGLKGDSIPLQGRIMAIADVYDALVSNRPYKKAFSHEKAVQIIIESKGSHFDPILVDLFLEVSDSFEKIHTE